MSRKQKNLQHAEINRALHDTLVYDESGLVVCRTGRATPLHMQEVALAESGTRTGEYDPRNHIGKNL